MPRESTHRLEAIVRTRAACLIVTAALAVVLGPSAAAGGGWWTFIDLQGRHIAIGETMTASAHVMFRDLEEAEAAKNGSYHAYLVRGWDRAALQGAMRQAEPESWWSVPGEAILVGDVRFTRWDSNLAEATAKITVPDVSEGRYSLMFCDVGCVTPLADVIPLEGVRVSTELLAAQTARRLDQLRTRTRDRMVRLRKELATAEAHAQRSEERAVTAVRAARTLRRQLRADAAAAVVPPVVPAAGASVGHTWTAFGGWFLAGAVIVAFAGRWRRWRSRLPLPGPGPGPDHERIIEDRWERAPAGRR